MGDKKINKYLLQMHTSKRTQQLLSIYDIAISIGKLCECGVREFHTTLWLTWNETHITGSLKADTLKPPIPVQAEHKQTKQDTKK